MSETATLTTTLWTSGRMWTAVLRHLACSAMVGGFGAGLLTGTALGQAAPRYQSPFGNASPQSPSLPVPAAITPNGTVVEDVIARVNDQIISRSDVERSQQQLQQDLQQNNLPTAEREQREKDMLRDMIDQQLLLSKGKELGLNADAELVRRLDEIRKQNHLDTMEDLEKAARQQGVNFEDFKASIRNNVVTQQVVRDEVGRRLQVTQGQEQAFYDAHKEEFAQPEQVRLSEILVPLAVDADPAAVAQAQKKADEIAAKVNAGGKFDELAKQYSGGPTAVQGGDLGSFKRGALAKVLEDQTFRLKPGESTAPTRTRQGFVILKVTEHQQPGVPPMKEVEQQIQEAMYMQQMQPALRAYLTRLREEAYIDIKPGFVDTGASSKQTKPVFSAYAAPTPKKKTVVQKARFDRGARSTGATNAGKVAPTDVNPTDTATKTAEGVPALPAEGTAVPPGDVAANTNVPPAAGGITTNEAGSVGSSGAATTRASAGDAPATTVTGERLTATTGKTRASAGTLTSSAKIKKIRREKVRFGQAPRNSLPAGSLETASGTDVGEGAASAALIPGGVAAQGSAPSTAPGSAIAPVAGTTEISANSDPDPLTPKTVSVSKTRFSSREKQVKAEKIISKQAKVREKAAAKPAGPDVLETTSQKTQAAPLGLNGDTAAKKKRVKVKGAPKERLQDKKPDVTPDTPIAPTVNPKLETSPEASTQSSPSADRTTLPPVTAPAPGTPPQGQPISPTGNPSTTPNGTPAPPQ